MEVRICFGDDVTVHAEDLGLAGVGSQDGRVMRPHPGALKLADIGRADDKLAADI